MVRTQIQLTEDHVERLKEMSRDADLSMAEIIRRGIEFYLQSVGLVSKAERKQRALRATGRFRSGCRDLAERHDDYFGGDDET